MSHLQNANPGVPAGHRPGQEPACDSRLESSESTVPQENQEEIRCLESCSSTDSVARKFLRDEVLDNMLLIAINPSGEGYEQNPQSAQLIS